MCGPDDRTVSTQAGSLNVTKPKPRDFPVAGFFMTTQSTTSPYLLKYFSMEPAMKTQLAILTDMNITTDTLILFIVDSCTVIVFINNNFKNICQKKSASCYVLISHPTNNTYFTDGFQFFFKCDKTVATEKLPVVTKKPNNLMT